VKRKTVRNHPQFKPAASLLISLGFIDNSDKLADLLDASQRPAGQDIAELKSSGGLIRLNDAAARIGVCRSTIKNWCESKILVRCKIGGVVGVTPASLEKAINSGLVSKDLAK
jgi:hypothetical protein